MKGKISSSSLAQRHPYGASDLQKPMLVHHQLHAPPSLHLEQQLPVHPPNYHQSLMMSSQLLGAFPAAVIPVDEGRNDRGKACTSDDDDPSFNTEEGADGGGGKGGRSGNPWHRMKWTDGMVKLMITIVSYLGEDASDCGSGGRRKLAALQKKGKWRSVSKVMAERGCYVSPQQCEDKFNDLNKRYKRLNDILGRGTSCEVVENPALLDFMDHVSNKAKNDVRKILSSKQLFYEEMCSYHNGNRLHLPADPSVQRSLQLALSSGDDRDTTKRALLEDLDVDDHGIESSDGEDEYEENITLRGDVRGSCFPKRMKHGVDYGEFGQAGGVPMQGISTEMNQVFPGASGNAWWPKWRFSFRSLELEEQILHIHAEMLELQNQCTNWQRFSKKKDRELGRMRMENERMKLENECMALELQHKEFELKHNATGNDNEMQI